MKPIKIKQVHTCRLWCVYLYFDRNQRKFIKSVSWHIIRYLELKDIELCKWQNGNIHLDLEYKPTLTFINKTVNNWNPISLNCSESTMESFISKQSVWGKLNYHFAPFGRHNQRIFVVIITAKSFSATLIRIHSIRQYF